MCCCSLRLLFRLGSEKYGLCGGGDYEFSGSFARASFCLGLSITTRSDTAEKFGISMRKPRAFEALLTFGDNNMSFLLSTDVVLVQTFPIMLIPWFSMVWPGLWFP